MVTTRTIIEYLKTAVENREVLSPAVWMDAATKLNLLIGDEQAILFGYQQNVAKEKAKLISEGKSVAAAKTIIEATDEYRLMKTQEAYISQIIEFIRISKLNARTSLEEIKGY